MYKEESIKKMISKATETMTLYRQGKLGPLTICISRGNRKIGRVLNVSLMPVMTCGNCKHCKGICYDIKACLQYSGVIPARVRNTLLAREHREEYFRLIDQACTRRKRNKYFRWHVAGEILDLDYFARMVEIARKHPDFRFWTYTKMYELVNQYCDQNGGKSAIPENLSIMFSEWKIQTDDGRFVVIPFNNPYGFPVFAVRFHGEEEPKHLFRCPGNCDICKESHHGCPYGESSYADEH